jgi:glycine cleavage system regulatory protein
VQTQFTEGNRYGGVCYVQGMQTSLVLTVIGDDKPGIVEQLSDRILATGANWEESRMARLAGKFAGLLRVSVDEEKADVLAATLRALDAGGLTMVVERSGDTPTEARRPIRLEVIGNDHPGIVRDISRALAQHRVNIEELETDLTSAPMSGDALFRARATLGVPAAVTIEQLRGVLEALAGELMVDLAISETQASEQP